ncbi:MAG: YihY/virulence factor BrkB family protein [Sphingomonadaceae bacterium]|nr:YihY/virulence factor BrkB family protein [Sphingomonadaceae bacterium]
MGTSLRAAGGKDQGSKRSAKAAPQRRGARTSRPWLDILRCTWSEFWDDQIPMIAAGVTFYTLLALFPAIGALVSLWGLLGNVGDARDALAQLSAVLPGGALTVISDEMMRVSAANTGGLTLAAAGGLLLSIWSANGAMSAIITGLNIAYGLKEERSFFRRTLVALAFTLAAILFAVAAVLVLLLPASLHGQVGDTEIFLLRAAGMAGLFAALLVGLSLLYHFGPAKHRGHWRLFTWGGCIAGICWLLVSIGFSLYVAHFGSYNRTYGSLGAVIGFMTWIWISAMVILVGAELNAEIESRD